MGGLILLAALAAVGRATGLRGARLWGVIATGWALLVAVHLAADAGAAGRLGGSAAPVGSLAADAARLTGGSARGWLVAGGMAALILGYRAVLAGLRSRSDRLAPVATHATPAAAAPAAADTPMSDAELDRYGRHLVLREIGGPGQMRLRAARVLIVGAGGLGAPVALYLAAAGVGRITLADDDTVSLSNLQRQILFRTADAGRPKVQAGADAMAALNPHVVVTPMARRITDADAALIAAHDLIIDGSDSFAGRAGVNRACAAAGVPLLAGAITQWEGQVTLYHPAAGAPCMACVFPRAPAPGQVLPCAEAGVVGALPGVVGSIMALEAIKHLAGVTATGSGQGLAGRMLLWDGLWGETRQIRLARDPSCPVCAGSFTAV